MAVEIFPENSAMAVTTSPRISFSYDLSQTDVVPVEQNFFRSSSSSSNIDFDFCVLESFSIQHSSADELFFDGKILPVQIQKKIVNPTRIPRPEPPKPPLKSAESSKKFSQAKHQTGGVQNSKSFWRFKRSSSLNCGFGYGSTFCPLLPLLSRSNSAGSGQQKSALKQSHQKPPLKRSLVGCNGNGVRVNPVLNVPTGKMFGLGSIFSSSKDKIRKK